MWYQYSIFFASLLLSSCTFVKQIHKNDAEYLTDKGDAPIYYSEYYKKTLVEKIDSDSDSSINNGQHVTDSRNEIVALQEDSELVFNGKNQNRVTSTDFSTIVVPAPEESMVTVKAGQCMVYAQIKSRPTVHIAQVTIKDSTNKISVTPAQLKSGYQQVVTREGVITYKIEPATFKKVIQKVLIKPEVTRLEVIPALYEKTKQRIKVENQQTVLEPCQAAGSKFAKVPGVVAYCAKQVPARYKTVEVDHLVHGERTITHVESAQYKTVSRWVVDKPAQAVEVQVEGEIKHVAVQKLIQDAQFKEQYSPAETKELKVTEYEGEPQVVVRRAVCDADITIDLVAEVQKKLAQAGYDPGPIDGLVGKRTIQSLSDYQLHNRLAMGALTFETLQAIGIKL